MTSDYHNLRPADPRGLERRREERAQRRAAEAVAATECARLRAEIEALRIEM